MRGHFFCPKDYSTSSSWSLLDTPQPLTGVERGGCEKTEQSKRRPWRPESQRYLFAAFPVESECPYDKTIIEHGK